MGIVLSKGENVCLKEIDIDFSSYAKISEIPKAFGFKTIIATGILDGGMYNRRFAYRIINFKQGGTIQICVESKGCVKVYQLDGITAKDIIENNYKQPNKPYRGYYGVCSISIRETIVSIYLEYLFSKRTSNKDTMDIENIKYYNVKTELKMYSDYTNSIMEKSVSDVA